MQFDKEEDRVLEKIFGVKSFLFSALISKLTDVSTILYIIVKKCT